MSCTSAAAGRGLIAATCTHTRARAPKVLFWDTRQGSKPVLAVAEAHGRKDIQAVDWSGLLDYLVATGEVRLLSSLCTRRASLGAGRCPARWDGVRGVGRCRPARRALQCRAASWSVLLNGRLAVGDRVADGPPLPVSRRLCAAWAAIHLQPVLMAHHAHLPTPCLPTTIASILSLGLHLQTNATLPLTPAAACPFQAPATAASACGTGASCPPRTPPRATPSSCSSSTRRPYCAWSGTRTRRCARLQWPLPAQATAGRGGATTPCTRARAVKRAQGCATGHVACCRRAAAGVRPR
jgi:hypothetical protein